MGARMKTTVELADSLAAEARHLAKREGTTLRALLEAGLRREIDERKSSKPFRLRDASCGAGGLRPEFLTAGGNPDWVKILDASYEGRGS